MLSFTSIDVNNSLAEYVFLKCFCTKTVFMHLDRANLLLISADYRKLVEVASGVEVEEVFEEALATAYNFRLTPSDLQKLKNIREEELRKKKYRRMKHLGLILDEIQPKTIFKTRSNNMRSDHTTKEKQNINTSGSAKVNIEYLLILLPYLKHYNSSCGFCVCTRYFGQDNVKPTSLLLRCMLKCNGTKCPFTCTVHVLNNDSCFIVSSNPNISHLVAERISRPIRGSRRREIMEKFQAGGSVYRVHAQYDQKRTVKEKKAFNHDTTGKSKGIFKKIKAEAVAATLLAPPAETGLSIELTSSSTKPRQEI